MRANRALWMGSAAVIATGIAVMIVDFREGGFFDVARVAIVLGGQLGVTAFFAGKRGNLDDAFQYGYKAGFHDGQRVRPKVIRLPIKREREHSPRR